MIVAVITFVAVFAIVATAYFAFVVKPERDAVGAVRRRLKTAAIGSRHVAALLKPESELSSFELIDALLRRVTSLTEPTQNLLDQAGSSLTVGRLVLVSACLGLLALVGCRLGGVWWSVAAVVAVASASLPTFFLRWQRSRRLLKFEELLPEALDLLARALRAGHAFTTGIAMIGDEMPAPIGPEFRLLHDRQNYGMPLPDALHDMARRIPVLDLKFFVTAVMIQREAGGNLSEILDNLSSVIRERFRVKRQVRVISAHGRITGWILGGLPPVLGACFMALSDQHMQTMFGDPLGVRILIGAACLQVVGMFIIRKIVNIEY